MIRAIRPNAMAQDDAILISGWNVAPNLAYILRLLPGTSSCGVLLYDADESVLIASGAALVGTDQPCVLIPQAGQTVEMVDADLGWHLRLTTAGTESQRTIRIGPVVDLPDEIHPVYGDDALALARATAAIDGAAHYIDDVTATCPLGLGAGLGDVVSVPVDGVAMVGQVESITWTATPDGTTEQAVIRRHVAIAPDAFVEPTLPVVADDTGATDQTTDISGNVLTNDEPGLAVTAVNGLGANVGASVAGSNGGLFTVAANGAWTFDPDGDFVALGPGESDTTSVTYFASNGSAESMASLIVTVTRPNIAPVAVNDAAETDAATPINGNVLTNDTDQDGQVLTVSRVGGLAANVGVAVAGSAGGVFTIASDGAWTFDPGGSFDSLTGEQTSVTSVAYHASDGLDESEATLSVTVSALETGISLVGTAYNGTGAAVASYVVNLPAGLQEGDIVIVASTCQYSNATKPAGPTTPGYTSVAAGYVNLGYDTNYDVSYKIMGATPDSSVTVRGTSSNSNAACAVVQVWRGVNQSTPMDVTRTVATGSQTTSADPPAITPSTARAMVIIAGMAVHTDALTPLAAPSGWDNLVSHAVDSNSMAALAALASQPWAGGTVNPSAFAGASLGNTTWAAVTLALRPA